MQQKEKTKKQMEALCKKMNLLNLSFDCTYSYKSLSNKIYLYSGFHFRLYSFQFSLKRY